MGVVSALPLPFAEQPQFLSFEDSLQQLRSVQRKTWAYEEEPLEGVVEATAI